MVDAPPPCTSADVAAVLSRAADLISPDGMWTTDHSWEDGRPPAKGFCLVDALIKAHPQGRMEWNYQLAAKAGLGSTSSTTAIGYQWILAPLLHQSWTSMREPSCGKIGMALHEVIDGSTGFPHGLVRWNDAPGRTQQEVVSALHRAAQHVLSAESKSEDGAPPPSPSVFP